MNKKQIIDFTLEHYKVNNKLPQPKDFARIGANYQHIWRLFGGINDLYVACGLPAVKMRTSKKMSDEELKNYLTINKHVDSNGCWTMNSYVDPETNRSKIYYKRKKLYLYRLSYLLFKGDLVPGKVVAHTCDNSLCFNPDHLELKTQKENIADGRKRGKIITKNNSKKNRHRWLKDPYNYIDLLKFVKENIDLSNKNEWLWQGSLTAGYPFIQINKISYILPRLILANKLGKKYEEVDITRHILPDGSKPKKHDVNPDHLFEGSQSDNANDTIAHRASCKLNSEAISLIKENFKNINSSEAGSIMVFDQKMALKFDVSEQVIKGARLNQSYGIYQKEPPCIANKEKPVVQLTIEGKILNRFDSATQAASILKYIPTSISKVCLRNRNTSGKLKTYKGFIWKFANE